MGERDIDPQTEILKAAGLDEEQITRLAALKQKVARGVPDESIELRRTLFVKYLYQKEIISG